MPHEVRAVVAVGRGLPVEVRTIVVPDPGPGEVLVAVQACGVCDADLRHRDGTDDDGGHPGYPALLGHEAAGTVEAVGPGVLEPRPGDFVVLARRAPCGGCRSCHRGRPWSCVDSRTAGQRMTLLDGTPLEVPSGVGAFARKTLVAAGQAVKVDPAARPEAAALIGCAVTTGYGAVVNTGRVGRGDAVAVVGCDAVGVAAIAGACLNGAMKVIAIDVDDRRLDRAEKFGATHTVNPRGTDPVAAVRELTGGHGVDIAVDAAGLPETFRQALRMRDHAGVLVQAGSPAPGASVELPLSDAFSRGGAVKSSWYGDSLPSRDFPYLVDQYLYGLLDLNAFVSETVALDQAEEAFARLRRGEVLRSVVVP